MSMLCRLTNADKALSVLPWKASDRRGGLELGGQTRHRHNFAPAGVLLPIGRADAGPPVCGAPDCTARAFWAADEGPVLLHLAQTARSAK